MEAEIPPIRLTTMAWSPPHKRGRGRPNSSPSRPGGGWPVHVEIADSFTLIPEDQPALLAAAMRTFLRETAEPTDPLR